jgi:hypothetical protein
MMHSPIALPFFLQYLTNAKYLISIWSITSKSTLIIPNNLIACFMKFPISILYYSKEYFFIPTEVKKTQKKNKSSDKYIKQLKG